MLRLMVWSMKQQISHGKYFLFENPPTSALWQCEELCSILNHRDVRAGIGHACAFGSVGLDGYTPIWKQYKWVSNSQTILAALCKPCPGHASHVSVSGRHTKHSGIYSIDLARAVASAVLQLGR